MGSKRFLKSQSVHFRKCIIGSSNGTLRLPEKSILFYYSFIFFYHFPVLSAILFILARRASRLFFSFQNEWKPINFNASSCIPVFHTGWFFLISAFSANTFLIFYSSRLIIGILLSKNFIVLCRLISFITTVVFKFVTRKPFCVYVSTD